MGYTSAMGVRLNEAAASRQDGLEQRRRIAPAAGFRIDDDVQKRGERHVTLQDFTKPGAAADGHRVRAQH